MADAVGHAEVAVDAAACWGRPVTWNIRVAYVEDGVLEWTVAGRHGCIGSVLWWRMKRRAVGRQVTFEYGKEHGLKSRVM